MSQLTERLSEFRESLHAFMLMAAGADQTLLRERIALLDDTLAALAEPDLTDIPERDFSKGERGKYLEHRCAGCDHRWTGPLKGTELCGDCWRKAQPVVHQRPDLHTFEDHVELAPNYRVRYLHDPIFHALAHGMATLMGEHGLSLADVKAAGDIAEEIVDKRSAR